MDVRKLFDLTGQVAVVCGGGGTLGGAIADGLAAAGSTVVVTSRTQEKAEQTAARIQDAGGTAHGQVLDTLDRDDLLACRAALVDTFGRIDILVNAVGGNNKATTTSQQRSFFELSSEALDNVMRVNVMGGAVLPSQVFGEAMLQNEAGGSIINISSMTALRPLTRVAGYSAAKAAVDNFTQWLAVHLAQEYSPKLRVNAIAPGFFLTGQNRFLLLDEGTGKPTARGQRIIDHTPMARYGAPEDLIVAALWLAGSGSRFVTGTVIPIDGGFSAFSGV